MSGNANAAHFTETEIAAAKADRRVIRTRDKLGGALVALMQEKSFADITVQDVLDRAGVGRSTFYTHFQDKDDLFLSDVEDFFRFLSTLLTRNSAAADRVAPIRELFAHISDVREFYSALIASGKVHDVVEMGTGFFARSIKERLLLANVKMAPAELDAHSAALAGSMFSLLTWWVDHGKTETPEAMDKVFHRIVWSGLTQIK